MSPTIRSILAAPIVPMKPWILLLVCALGIAHARAGGPSIDTNDLKVGRIILADDEIVMEIAGSFRLFTAKVPEEGTDGGNAKWVPMAISHGLLRIPRKKWKHPGGDDFEVYLDWDAYKKKIKKWEGREISSQMWSTTVILREGNPREIIAEVCKIREKSKSE